MKITMLGNEPYNLQTQLFQDGDMATVLFEASDLGELLVPTTSGAPRGRNITDYDGKHHVEIPDGHFFQNFLEKSYGRTELREPMKFSALVDLFGHAHVKHIAASTQINTRDSNGTFYDGSSDNLKINHYSLGERNRLAEYFLSSPQRFRIDPASEMRVIYRRGVRGERYVCSLDLELKMSDSITEYVNSIVRVTLASC